MTFVLIAAEIDLSVGSVLGLCGAVLGVTITNGTGLVGGGDGGGVNRRTLWCLNGAISIRWQLPSFIVTLGMMEMAAAVRRCAKSQTQYIGPAIEGIAGTTNWACRCLSCWRLLCHHFPDQSCLEPFWPPPFATGAHAQTRLSSAVLTRGVSSLIVFILAGFLTALAAIIDTSRFQSTNPNGNRL